MMSRLVIITWRKSNVLSLQLTYRSRSCCANLCADIIRIICDYSNHEDIYTY